MIVLGGGDNHIDWSSKRWSECVRIHEFIIAEVERIRPNLYIFSGDMYERASQPQERIFVADMVRRIADVCDVLIVKGNHDPKRDCELLSKLEARHRIVVEEGAAVHYFGELAVAAIAWPDRASLLAYARANNAPADTLAQHALSQVCLALGQSLAQWDGPTMGVGHLMVNGSVTSVGQPMVGQPIEVTLSDLANLHALFVLLGHVHKPQAWKHAGTQIVYGGSPYRTSYGELEGKSIVRVEFDGAKLKGWSRIQTPCGAMHLAVERWSYDPELEEWGFDAGPEAHTPEDVRGAEIRLRYDVEVDQRAAAALEAEQWKKWWLDAGAIDVQVEDVVITHNRARAPEIATAQTLADKLLTLWQSKGTMPESPRREHLLEMADQLQQQESA